MLLLDTKFDPRSEKVIFLSYDRQSPAYLIYFPESTAIKRVTCIKFTDSYNSPLQFSISTLFSSIWLIDWTLSGAPTPDQSGPGTDGSEGVLCIPQSSINTGISPSNYLVSYPGHSMGRGLTSLQRCNQYILQPQLTGQQIVGLNKQHIWQITAERQPCHQRGVASKIVSDPTEKNTRFFRSWKLWI